MTEQIPTYVVGTSVLSQDGSVNIDTTWWLDQNKRPVMGKNDEDTQPFHLCRGAYFMGGMHMSKSKTGGVNPIHVLASFHARVSRSDLTHPAKSVAVFFSGIKVNLA